MGFNLPSGCSGTRFLLASCALALCCGCPAPNNTQPHPITETQALKDKVDDQARRLAAKDEQLRTQAELIQSLQKLNGERKIDDLIHVDKIEIDRLSGGYDENDDGIDDGVRVYLRLYDQFGGIIRATGAAQIQVFDLSRTEGNHLVGEAQLSPEQMKSLWFGGFMTNHYTIDVKWKKPEDRPTGSSTTVLANFTDLLSGRSFEAQQVVQLTVPPKPTK